MCVVIVRNELTGETASVEVGCAYGPDAQIEALIHCFRAKGWRKALAEMPMALNGSR